MNIKKIGLVAFVLFLFVSVAVFANPQNVKGQTYSLLGSGITIYFGNSGVVIMRDGSNRWDPAGTFRISGNTITVSFYDTGSGMFSSFSGTTARFTYVDSNTLEESGVEWIRR
jgi:hypothetical protein